MVAKPPEPGAASRTVAATVRRLRLARDLTLPGLSAEVAKHGWNLSDQVLCKIENGRLAEDGTPASKYTRSITVDDLVALAAALDVTPMALLDGTADLDVRGASCRSVSMVEELDAAVRDVADPAPGTDIAARVRTARRLMAQIGLELEEAEDRMERDRGTGSDKEGKD